MIQQLFFKNETLISAFIVLCTLISSFVFKNQTILSISIFLILMFVVLLSFINFRIGVLVFASSFSLNGIVRMYDLDNQLTAGFTFFHGVLLLLIILIISVLKNQITIHKSGFNFVLLYSLTLCMVFVYSVFGSYDLFSFVLYVREYIIPLLVFFIFLYVLNKDLYFFNKIIIFIVLTTTFVAIVNIYHYFYGLDIEFNQYVTGSSTNTRSLFGYQIPRLSHILGIGGEAAGGLFYIFMSILSLLVVKRKKIFLNILLIISSGILAFTSILTVSSSVALLMLSFIFWIVIFKFFNNLSVLRFLIFLTLVPIILLILVYPFGINEVYDSISSYALDAFIGKFIDEFYAFTLLDHLVGKGLSLPGKGGLVEGALWTRPDLWIFSLYVQFGIIGFTIFLTFWLYPLLKIILDKTKISQDVNSIHFICGFIIVACFTSAHAVAILLRLFSPLLMLAFATIYVSFFINNLKKPT